jgi:WD40 repeat protein/tRNA A-37 threonylcarbamoyl transferase component Bud32
MSPPHPAPLSGASHSPGAAQLLDLFELTWQSGAPPRLEEFLPPLAPSKGPADPARRALLHELITIDLEYRWRRSAQAGGNAPPGIESYVGRYPELGPPEGAALDLIGYEYRVRHSWGGRPGHDEYTARFPRHGTELSRRLAEIDAELAVEFAPAALPVTTTADTPPAAVTAGSALVRCLRECRLLSAAQLDEVERQLQVRFPDARGLARELLQRGWLTPLQANQLLQGRGADLILGPYIVLERLGEGGGGQVFKARHQKLGRAVALKLIRKELLTDAEVLGRFYREIQVVSQLDHPNVVRAYDAGPVGGTHFLAMELVEGTDLGRLIKKNGPLPVTEACEYIRQAACGLAHAHEKGLVHRDVKPHNLLLSKPDGPHSLDLGTVKVADLGLARMLRVATEATAVLAGVRTTGTLTPENAVMIGTADYLAPEQALDFHAADIRADIYSLGCTLYYLLAGRPPFVGGTLAQKVAKHLQGEFPPVRELRPEVPAEVAALLARMVARRPEDRFQAPAEVAAALADLQAGGAARRFGQSGGRHRRGLLAAAGLVLLGLSPLLWWLAGRSQTPEEKAQATLNHFLALTNDPERSAGDLDRELLAFRRRHPEMQERLRQELLAVQQRSAGTPQGGRAASLVMQLPSPLDHLDERQVPAAQRFPGLVAVAGISSGAVWAMALSPDGRLLACNGQTPGTLQVWGLTGAAPTKLIERKGHTDAVRGLAFAPDGTALASASLDKTVCLWDLSTGVPERGAVWEGHGKPVHAVAFTPDGKAVASGGDDAAVRLWDPATGKARVLAHFNLIRTLDFAPNGKLLAVAGVYGPSAVRVLSIADPGHVWDFVLKGHTGLSIPCVAFAPDGQTLASGGVDHTVRLWDVAAQAERPHSPLMGHGPAVAAVAFAPDGQTLASVDRVPEGGPSPTEYRLILWDVASGTKRRDWMLPRGGARCVKFAADGRHLFVGGMNGTLYVLRVTPPVSRLPP